MLAPFRRRRLRAKVHHVLRSTMLCCGRRKEAREQVAGEMASTRRAAAGGRPARTRAPPPEMVVVGDFRKVSGISTEIFNQIQAVENDHDATTAASLEAVEKRGEMVIRVLDLRTMGRAAAERARRFLSHDPNDIVQFIEIVKRPGQTLGLYIREGNGIDRHEGVFISRIALESAVYNSGCLHVGDEILAVNLVDVTNVSLDDVVIIMSIPRRLVLTTRSRKPVKGARPTPVMKVTEQKGPPVVVIKKEFEEEPQEESNSNGENGVLMGMPGAMPPPHPMYTQMEHMYMEPSMAAYIPEEQYLYYNSQPQVKYRPPRVGVRQMVPLDREPWMSEPGPSTMYPRVVTDQPRTLHAYPKTLESLAEKVHMFYAGSRGGVEPSGRYDTMVAHPSTSLGHPVPGARTLPPSRSERTLAPRRVSATGRLLRAESDQRLAGLSRDLSPLHEPVAAGRPLRPSLKAPSAPPPTPGPERSARYADAMQRLSALRRRVATESFSDTEAQTLPRGSILVRQTSFERTAKAHAQLRSNSLPRMRSDYRRHHRHTVRFERDTLPHDSQEESDGAVSAPELPVRRERVRIPSSASVFTAAEYRAWLNRAPSTSAIYEKLKRSREVLYAQRTARATYSAENLLDRRGEEQPFYYRTIAGRPMSRPSRGGPLDAVALSSRRVRYLLDDGRHIPNPTPAKPSEFHVHLLDINPAEFLKYRPEKEPLPTPAEESTAERTGDSREEKGFSGLLWVHLLAGRGLKTSDRTEHYRDLYCVLECDHVHKARTVVRTGDQNFDWDETFELDLMNNRELDFLVYSWDPQFRHKLCYKGSIQLSSILLESPVHQLALKIEPRGTLYLKLRYTDPRQAFKRVASTRKGALFGVDLDTVVNRENSGFNVPIILKRCIEEVEGRGLDIIGLYRLCGSASKKRMLKEAFERNPRRVDTSPDNVPDINVITGVLKDYLRELPEPMFTKCLNQMLVDALSVCLPEDPEGNAKLMFSILDCLPKINRCSLMMLMDHLKLVASQSERNKMTPQNLAVCFAPVLLIHTDASTTTVDFQTPVNVLKYLLEIWPSKQGGSGSDESNGRNADQDRESSETKKEDDGDEGGEGGDGASASSSSSKPVVTWSGQQRLLPESSC